VAKPKKKGPPSTERKIHFYRVNAGLRENGKPRRLNFEKALELVEKKAFADDQRYWVLGDGNAVAGWPESGRNRPALELATLRRTNLPRSEKAGVRGPLGLPPGTSLHEGTHIEFFPKGIVGVEFNFYGTRASRLPDYLRRATDNTLPAFTLEPLLRQDAAKQLDGSDHLRVLDLRVRSSYAATVAEADQSLGAALTACQQAGGSDVVHLVLEPEPYKRTALRAGLLRGVRRLARRSDLQDNALTFKVKAVEDDRVDLIDLLKDELVVTKRVVKVDEISRAVDDASVYQAIEEAYAELKPELELAASIAEA
jgi:hypothetical protein